MVVGDVVTTILAGQVSSKSMSPANGRGGSTGSGPLGVGVVAVVHVCLPEYLTKASCGAHLVPLHCTRQWVRPAHPGRNARALPV